MALRDHAWAHQPQLAGLKLLARTEQVLAAQEAAAQQWDDALMLDAQDHVISSTRGNIFAFFGGQCAHAGSEPVRHRGNPQAAAHRSSTAPAQYAVDEQRHHASGTE